VRQTKVVHLASSHLPVDVRIFHKECRSLEKAGYSVSFVVPAERMEMVDGVRIRPIPKSTSRVGRLTRGLWHSWRAAVREKADVYHFHDIELIPVGLVLRLAQKYVIYDVHEDYPRRGIFAKYFLGWLADPVEKLASRNFSAVVVASPEIAARFLGSNKRTVLVRNYASLEEFAALGDVPWNRRACTVAYVGGVSMVRGIREMVEAMQLLPERLGATLNLAGPFQSMRLKEEVVRLPGWRHVNALGYLERAGVVQMLGNAQAGLLLLHPIRPYVTALPTKLFEYMAASIPVIASDFPMWREVIQSSGCGLLVDPLNPSSIAQAINYILTHTEEAEAMGCRGRKAVEEKYNWKGEESELLGLYASVLEEPSKSGGDSSLNHQINV
jgi:glycosyltransferase involved in cell wall biosynthesis